jgi:CRISPR/Cas system CSM-associated protein Csm2 small subunit
MKYNPEKELTDEQMKELSEDAFFEYLDSKAAYLKEHSAPLNQYHVKKFASVTMGGNLSTKQLRRAKEVGREGEWIRNEKLKEAAKHITAKVPELNVRGHKTNRRQWID